MSKATCTDSIASLKSTCVSFSSLFWKLFQSDMLENEQNLIANTRQKARQRRNDRRRFHSAWLLFDVRGERRSFLDGFETGWPANLHAFRTEEKIDGVAPHSVQDTSITYGGVPGRSSRSRARLSF